MKLMKKLTISLLVLSISLNMFGTAVANAESYEAPCGARIGQTPISLQEQLIDVQNNTELSSEEKNLRIEKIQHLIDIQNGATLNTRSTIPTSVTLTVQFHSQLNGDYCGPATTQQTYEYLYYMKNGRYYAPSQSAIAEKIGTTEDGTDFQPILDYLNNSNLACSYSSSWWWSNQDAYDTMVKESIADTIPVVLYASIPSSIVGRSSTSDRTKWLFATSGHYLNISGYTFTNTSTKYYEVTDPYADRYPNYSSGKYNVNNTVVKSGTVAIGC